MHADDRRFGTGIRDIRLMIVRRERRTAKITGERADLVIEDTKARRRVPSR